MKPASRLSFPFVSRSTPSLIVAVPLLLSGWLGAFSTPAPAADVPEQKPLSVLLIKGENPYHDTDATSPVIEAILERDGRFEVDIVKVPTEPVAIAQFQPPFADFDVVMMNYAGPPWSESTRAAFEAYVEGGGGMVSVHAADNAFPTWVEYNRMTGLGGWGNRNEKDGPYVRWDDQAKRFVRDLSPGKGGDHGGREPFLIVVRDAEHPITAGLPRSFMQTNDELYALLRGPAENMDVLATAYSDPGNGGSGYHEPMLMVIRYGEGRVFHTVLGHDVTAMNGVAFQETLRRGTEWAATGEVTLPEADSETLPADRDATSDPLASDPIPDTEGPGWTALFNGTDLTGWQPRNGTATYAVDDEAIVGRTAAGSPNSFLCTQADYGDFDLTFEVNVDVGLNSGVQIRSQSKPEFNKGRVHGPQVEIESSPGESGYIYSEATGRNWLSDPRPITDAYRNGIWNRFVVRARGPRIETWVNGIKVADLTDEASSQSGFIGLQVHGISKDSGPFEVRWRDIRVRTR